FFYDQICGENGPSNYGILEVVDAPGAKAAPDSAYDSFKSSRIAALNWPIGPTGSYTTSDGRVIGFDILGATIKDLGGISAINGTGYTRVSNWFFMAQGSVINSAGDGLITISNPEKTKTLTLDFRDLHNPTWTKNY